VSRLTVTRGVAVGHVEIAGHVHGEHAGDTGWFRRGPRGSTDGQVTACGRGAAAMGTGESPWPAYAEKAAAEHAL
jgi:hypothetical protein